MCDNLTCSLCDRVLAATEESNRMEQSNLEELELKVRRLQQELEGLHRDKVSACSDVSLAQQQLRGRRGGRYAMTSRLHFPPCRSNSGRGDRVWTVGLW